MSSENVTVAQVELMERYATAVERLAEAWDKCPSLDEVKEFADEIGGLHQSVDAFTERWNSDQVPTMDEVKEFADEIGGLHQSVDAFTERWNSDRMPTMDEVTKLQETAAACEAVNMAD